MKFTARPKKKEKNHCNFLTPIFFSAKLEFEVKIGIKREVKEKTVFLEESLVEAEWQEEREKKTTHRDI